ncbi:ArsR/SmtB family transcription factor [Methanothermobacter wolfeii]|uniref:ArsR/SmtB family transcription factor n=1 Tax=Methanothermobacter wolfeii TaxID=145261 RepID=UPI0024B3A422|nr:metalloregulator ArsR/SmtB family transcription factor [Methanothermobacter wolfeii]MDI6702317.1 metalloregulator ArsR/SmtB family transcription factor [Methanothermobacter wolfeii]MDI6842289.1 metalloregulator ArsR/SmtB family transcription factor [Methanothermobacter wolfeii]
MSSCKPGKPDPEDIRLLKEKLEKLSEDDMVRKSEILKALADSTRLLIVHLLSSGELCVCEIMAALEKPQPTVSHHLNVLKQAGILKSRKVGVWVHYSLADEKLPGKIDEILKII